MKKNLPAKARQLARYLQSKNVNTRERAINRVIGVQSEEIFQLLVTALDDGEQCVRDAAVDALGYFHDSRVVEKLIPLFDARETYETDLIIVTSEKVDGEKMTIHDAPRFSLLGLVEAIGRTGDPRALPMLTPEHLDSLLSSYIAPTRIRWAIASIAARTKDFAVRQQAARQLIHYRPWEEMQDRHLLHRLPWDEKDMLDCIANLLTDSDTETCHLAAMFLDSYGDQRGVDALLALGERPDVGRIVEVLGQPKAPRSAVGDLTSLLTQWEETLTDAERQQITTLVPEMLKHAKKRERGKEYVQPHIIEHIRHVRTEEADRLVDEWLTREIHTTFGSFIERGDPSGVPNDFTGLSIISISHNLPGARILTHPLLRHYALPALQARFEYLRERDETSHADWLVAIIGWLGDPQALPFLNEELQRREQEDADNLRGEFIYAIANIKHPESIPVLISCFTHANPRIRRETVKPMRDFVKAVPDERVIQAITESIGPEDNLYGGLDMELIEAIGIGGAPVAVPYLVKLLSKRDFIGTEAVSSLVHIAQKNPDNDELVREIVEHLAPLLSEKTIVPLNYFYQPLSTMELDVYTTLALKDIGTPEALAAVEAWRHQQHGKDT